MNISIHKVSDGNSTSLLLVLQAYNCCDTMSYRTKLMKECICGSVVKSGQWKHHKAGNGVHQTMRVIAGCVSCRQFSTKADRTGFYAMHKECKSGKTNDSAFVKAYKAFISQHVDVS